MDLDDKINIFSKNKKLLQIELADNLRISCGVIDNCQQCGFVPTADNELMFHFK